MVVKDITPNTCCGMRLDSQFSLQNIIGAFGILSFSSSSETMNIGRYMTTDAVHRNAMTSSVTFLLKQRDKKPKGRVMARYRSRAIVVMVKTLDATDMPAKGIKNVVELIAVLVMPMLQKGKGYLHLGPLRGTALQFA